MSFKNYIKENTDEYQGDVNKKIIDLKLNLYQIEAIRNVYDKNKDSIKKIIEDIGATHEIESTDDWDKALKMLLILDSTRFYKK